MKPKRGSTILAIETSCDDTSIALVKCSGTLKSPKFQVVENIISSQIAIHRPFGGVVPNLAKREHIKNLPIVLRQVLKRQAKSDKRKGPNSKKSNVKSPARGEARQRRQMSNVDYVAVTVGPGLEPALWTGINFAKQLRSSLTHAEQNAEKRGKIRRDSALNPRKSAQSIGLIGVNHMEGHLYSNWLPIRVSGKRKAKSEKSVHSSLLAHPSIKFPAIALIVSGGHTILLHMTAINKWTKLGETLDDAAGEAFDKVARMLNLPYPGGPEIQKLAAKGDPNAIKFPRPMLNKPGYEFSFSGLKTSVLYYLRDHQAQNYAENNAEKRRKILRGSALSPRNSADAANIAASFQQAVIDVLVKKTIRAAEEYKAKSILLCGGVSANRPLREQLNVNCQMLNVKFEVPSFEFNTDNAAMIAAAAYINLLQKNKARLPIKADGNLNL